MTCILPVVMGGGGKVAGSEWESAVSESAPLAALESEFVVEA